MPAPAIEGVNRKPTPNPKGIATTLAVAAAGFEAATITPPKESSLRQPEVHRFLPKPRHEVHRMEKLAAEFRERENTLPGRRRLRPRQTDRDSPAARRPRSKSLIRLEGRERT